MIYLDASAFVKLILGENQSEAMIDFARERKLASSDLLRVEVPRAIRRRATGDLLVTTLGDAAPNLDKASLIAPTIELLDRAGAIDDPSPGSLDAIHVATALSVHDELEAFVTYDERQARAAHTAGLTVVQPGR